jgi:hypothetical protein
MLELSDTFVHLLHQPFFRRASQPLKSQNTLIFISFDGGTGRFERAKGTAIATGLDFPFGGVNGDPGLAGVVVDPIIPIVDSTIEGVLRLK